MSRYLEGGFSFFFPGGFFPVSFDYFPGSFGGIGEEEAERQRKSFP